ncbi:ubiquitin carboxyl-terminal hydrolase 36-like isoform X1 [Stegodyphus dumicola]|uniref:ubiquitin carboxyl-terminal hydrolase 36-like isoform X1 n=1 Tax=Stegodyphus dumicola TaxID=202533 RepID=UPI0015B3155F|nr:ubiquitin carboxyl-terminal hydrolase 36-like isoform X1 [Stegodyphus dumicola]XP_035211829.1 ubiquitin carboxyl-terminal hydrolase 36-like isoform X1 [Stegodyphus dumicola]XP_035211830.1 ubiquitin carboxyl-terminal hydrolase 36-like isoform X1 [Stegodyphus dumicola]
MNATIAAGINCSSINEQVANGSRSSILASNVDFSVTGNKSSFCQQGKYFYKAGGREEHFNGQKKTKSIVDQNKNTLVTNSHVIVNGNKEKSDDSIPPPKVQLYTGKIYVEWKQVYKIGAGLNNLGNTCFMNTVIQCLTYCPPLANYLLLDNDHPSKCTITGFCMMCLLQKHMKRAIGKSGDVIKPVDVYPRLKLIAKHFQFGQQEDAHEFLRYVIDHLWRSCLHQNNGIKLDPASKETTVINQIFGGYHRSQVTCLRCREKSNTFDHFMDFILDIKQNVLTLEKALEKFIQPEILEQENAYKCPKCKMKVVAQKRFSVFQPPNVATFQLKRFDYHRTFGGKITKQITYPERLNLRPYMSDPKGDPVWYHLYAVLVHSGPTCNSGHYYCYVKNSNNLWYIMDDQRVHQVSLNQVLNQSAYVLFYIKKGTTEGTSIKKNFENRNSLVKGTISSPNFKRVAEISSIKSTPLKEVQTSVSSPTAKLQVYSFTNINKKMSSPNQSKEKVSSGIHPSMPVIQEMNKPCVSLHATKKVKQCTTVSKADHYQCGLVPYIEDSSESSDENNSNRPSNTKITHSQEASISVLGTPKDDGAKQNLKSVTIDKPSPHLDIRRKTIKTALNSKSVPSSPIFTNSISPKVIATGTWTVTDAHEDSPSAGSCSSNNTVNSTSDWHVTSTNTDLPLKKPVHKFSQSESNMVSKESGHNSTKKLSEYNTHTSGSVMNSPAQKSIGKNSLPGGDKAEFAASSCEISNVHSLKNPASSKCDFRKQPSQNEKPFLESEGKFNRREHDSSFLKRKCNDFTQKVSENSIRAFHCENRYSSVPKKAKYTQELNSSSEKERTISGSIHKLSSNMSKVSQSYSASKNDTVHFTKDSYSKINYSQQNGSISCHSDKVLRTSEKTKVGKKLESDCESLSSSESSSSGSLEYEWVEKTKDDIESHQSSSKGKIKMGNDYQKASSSSQILDDRKQNVVSELTKNSSYFYGAEVPTWKGEKHYKNPAMAASVKRKLFDVYDDEFDRGKVRKFKPKDKYQHYYKHNPFQKYAERNHGHLKFNGKFHHGQSHYYKGYGSHNKWKQHQRQDFQKHKKYYRHNFQR